MSLVSHRRLGPRTQRGVAGIMAMLFLIVVVAFSAVTLLNMATSDLHDSTAQNDGVAALFLAESGIERAAQMYAAGAACSAPPGSSLQQPDTNFPRGTIEPHLDPITTLPIPPTPSLNPTGCQIEVLGRVGNTTRTVRADLGRGSITFLSSSSGSVNNNTVVQWPHTIPAAAGGSRIVVVGVSVRGAYANVSGTYGGAAMTRYSPVPPPNGNVHVEWFYRLNPPTGTNRVRVTFNINVRAVGGAFAFSGVNQLAPIDASASGVGNYPTNPGLSVTPVTDKTWVVDVLAVQPNTTAVAALGQTNPVAWRTTVGTAATGIYGAGSYRGPVSPAAMVTMSWTLSPIPPVPPPTNAWAHSVLVLQPLVQVVRWTEL